MENYLHLEAGKSTGMSPGFNRYHRKEAGVEKRSPVWLHVWHILRFETLNYNERCNIAGMISVWLNISFCAHVIEKKNSHWHPDDAPKTHGSCESINMDTKRQKIVWNVYAPHTRPIVCLLWVISSTKWFSVGKLKSHKKVDGDNFMMLQRWWASVYDVGRELSRISLILELKGEVCSWKKVTVHFGFRMGWVTFSLWKSVLVFSFTCTADICIIGGFFLSYWENIVGGEYVIIIYLCNDSQIQVGADALQVPVWNF